MEFKLGLTKKDVVRIAYAAAFAFVGAFVVAAAGAGPVHDLPSGKAAVLAGFAAGVAAVLSAIKNAVLADGSTAKG